MRRILGGLARLLGWLMIAVIGGAVGALITMWYLQANPTTQRTDLIQWSHKAEPTTLRVAIASPAPPTPTATPTHTPTPTRTPTPEPTPAHTRDSAPTPTPSIAEVVQRVGAAVVTVVNYQGTIDHFGVEMESEVRGSGVIVHPQGYIVTNHHVIADHQNLEVILADGRVMEARWVASDPDRDLALIQIDGTTTQLPVAPWGDSDSLRPGEWVLAIGSALGDLTNTVTFGIVSGVNRQLDLEEGRTIEGLIQTDAAINRGNSGGPLVNLHGEIVGINAWIIRQDDGPDHTVAEGLGFAIPSRVAHQIVSQWIAIDSNNPE